LVAIAAPLIILVCLGLAEFAARQLGAVAHQAAVQHLDAVRAAAENAAAQRWARFEDGVRRLAADGDVGRALLELSQATRDSEGDPRIDAAALAPQRAALAAHLQQWYAPVAAQRPPFDDAVGLPATRRAQWLQAQYVAGAGLAADGAFAAAHAAWHPRLAAAAADLEAADLLLVRASDGLVVYNVAKTPVFQTGLLDGSFSDSRLGMLVRRARSAPAAGALARADFAPFVAARGTPLAFVAAPLFADGTFVGTLVAAVDSRPLDRALAVGGALDALGLGGDGEVRLIGSDGTPRSTAGGAAQADDGAPQAPTPAVLGGAGTLEYQQPDGRLVLASIGEPGFGDLAWQVVASRDAAVAGSAAAAGRRTLYGAAFALALLLIAALAAIAWWTTVPFQQLAAGMLRLRPGDPRARVAVLGRGEAAIVAQRVNELLAHHRDERGAAHQARERDVRAVAAAIDTWQPGEPAQRIPTGGELAAIGTALGGLADRLDDTARSARLVPTPAAEALRAAAEQLRRDAERNLDALNHAESEARRTLQGVERALALAGETLDGGRGAEEAARAEQVTLRRLAETMAQAGNEARDDRDAGSQVLAALDSGASAAAALVDELSILAVNAALQAGDRAAADDPLAESARVAVERAEQVGTELDATRAEAHAALGQIGQGGAVLDRSALDVAERDLTALVGALERTLSGAAELDAQLRAAVEGRIEQAVHAAVDSARRLRQTAELVASEAAAVAGGGAAQSVGS
jgi:methyl-accepting chemotaxis protein